MVTARGDERRAPATEQRSLPSRASPSPVDREARGFRAGRELSDSLQERPDDCLRRHDEERACEDPLPGGVRLDVGALERVGAEVEPSRDPELRERLAYLRSDPSSVARGR